jgi:uncharacterized protein
MHSDWNDLEVLAPELLPFFRAARTGDFRLPRCLRCNRFQWPPRPVCRYCHFDEMGWSSAESRGSLYSWTTTYRAFEEDLTWHTPYTIAVVTLDVPDLVRLVGRMSGSPADSDLHDGARVTGHFAVSGARRLPALLWRLAD